MSSEVVDVILSAIQSTAKVLLIGLGGAYLARIRVLESAVAKGLSEVIVNLLTPCLLFSKVTPVVSADKVLEWWPLVFFSLLITFLGILLGLLVGKYLLHVDLQTSQFMMVCFAFKNTNSLPLPIIGGLLFTSPALWQGRYADYEEAERYAAAYVLFFTAIVSVLRWTIGFQLMKGPKGSSPPPAQEARGSEPEPEGAPAGGAGGEAGDEEEEDEMTEIRLQSGGEEDEEDAEDNDGDDDGRRRLTLRKQSSRRRTIGTFKRAQLLCGKWRRSVCTPKATAILGSLKDLFNPPMVAIIFSLAIGLSPPLKGLLYGDDAPLGPTVASTISTLGDCCVPMILLGLGAKLSKGPMPSKMSRKIPVSIIMYNLLLLPTLVSLIVMGMKTMNWLPDDPLMQLVILFQAAGPTAINTMVLATYIGSHEQETANLLFFSYLCAIFSLTACSVVFVHILT